MSHDLFGRFQHWLKDNVHHFLTVYDWPVGSSDFNLLYYKLRILLERDSLKRHPTIGSLKRTAAGKQNNFPKEEVIAAIDSTDLRLKLQEKSVISNSCDIFFN